MTLNNSEDQEGMSVARGIVYILVVIALLVVAYILFVQFFSFGAQPGLPPTHRVQDVPFTRWVDHLILQAPVFAAYGAHLLNGSPQERWQAWITGWGFLMITSCLALLVVKRIFETANDETTVMHLKGDTDTALRAKGGRG